MKKYGFGVDIGGTTCKIGLFETEYIMKSPAMMDAIRKGAKEIESGNCFSQHEGESMSDFLNRMACTE